MSKKLPGFDPRQEMRRGDYEIAHKQDTYLKNVELHHHDFYEVYFLLSGDVTYTIEGRIYHVMPGDMLIINPRELHQVGIRPDMAPYERYVLWIAPSLMETLSTPDTDLCACFDQFRPGYSNQLHLTGSQRDAVRPMMEMIYQETERSDFGGDVLSYHLLSALMILVNRIAQQGGIRYPVPEQGSQLVSQVIDYLNLHYSESCSLDGLADQFYISKYHLSHEFNKHMGIGLYQYLQRKRLVIARQLMSQGKKPVEVYAQCGFEDYAGFYRAFRRIYGKSPREYIQSLKTVPEELTVEENIKA